MHRSIATVDLKPTVFADMLCDSQKRKPLARQCYHMSDEVESWEAAKGESWGAERTST